MWGLRQPLLLLLLIFSLAQTDPPEKNMYCSKKALPYSRPYMAALMDSNDHFVCGGFLVNTRWVMTSARCKKVSKVFLGVHVLKNAKEYHKVARRYVHEEYMFHNTTFSNDILLLKLRSEVRPSKNINILQLPKSNNDLSDGTKCSVAGWSLEENCTEMLYEDKADIYNRGKCQLFYPKIDYGKICAGNRERGEKGQNFKQGEKGDPLVCNGEAHGILSYSNPCPPAVYTRIANYLPWIKKTMAQ